MKIEYPRFFLLCGLVLAAAFVCATAMAQSGPVITEGFSGTWYEPETSGQGFTVQVLNADSAVITWYTFDLNGNQFWLQAVGDINGNQMVFEDLMRVKGPTFGPDYDSDDREWIPAGSVVLTFQSCNQAVAQYSGSSELPPDTLDLIRLTYVAGYECNHTSPVLSPPIYPGLSGIWYDPSTSGQGWMVEILDDDSALIYWFTQDLDGEQMWLLGVADRVNNGYIAADMDRPHGAEFGPGFDKDDVIREDWGRVSLSYVGCNRAVVSYQAIGAEGQGWVSNVVPLAPVGYADTCAFPGGFGSMSGQLTVASQSWVDSDTNDLNSEYAPNDAASNAQHVGNPATISGFVTAEPLGHGRFENGSDLIDAYRLPLVAGQSVQLIVADWVEGNPLLNDLDIWLYDVADPSQPVDTSESISRNEFIQVQESGTYYVVVFAYAGSSSYTLHASYAPVPAQAQLLSSLDQFVESEVLVGIPDAGAVPSPIPPMAPQQLAAERGLELVQASPRGASLFRLKGAGHTPQSGGGPVPEASAHPLEDAGWGLGLAAQHGRQNLIAEIKSLQGSGTVDYAHPNYTGYELMQASDPFYPYQWHYNQINVPQAWQISEGDSDVVVAVIDSGVAPHSDLEPNVRRDLGLDAVMPFYNVVPLTGYVGDDPSDREDYHGTHVAGTVAAVANNGEAGTGVAPNVGIMPIRGLGGLMTLHSLLNSIYWAAGHSNYIDLPDPSRSADIINMSLGAQGNCPSAFVNALAYARSQGLITIAAAGNNTSNLTFSPAGCPGVVSVSATNRTGNPAFYSNCGSHVDVAAPGGETVPSVYKAPNYLPHNSAGCRHDPGTMATDVDGVWSTMFSGSFPFRQATFEPNMGTSMAAPHVAGVAALMRSVHPGLSPMDFDAMLSAGALTSDLGPAGWDPEYGHGLIDARKAVEAALSAAGGGAIPGSLIANPSFLDFGELQVTRTIEVSRSGGGSGSVSGFFTNREWLVSAVGIDVDSGGYGLYEIGIDRTGFVEGLHQGSMLVQTSDGLEMEVAVSMRVGAQAQQGQAGFLYLVVLDAVTGSIVGVLAGASDSGVYSYAVPDLVPGEYLLITTSDMDQDFSICDFGEYCGYYPGVGPVTGVGINSGSQTQVQTITVYPDRTGLGEQGAAQMLSIQSNASGIHGNLQVLDAIPDMVRPAAAEGGLEAE